MRLRPLWQDPFQQRAVLRRDLGWAAQRPAFPRRFAFAEPALPLAHRRRRHPQPSGHLGLRHPFAEQLHATLPSPFHRCEISSCLMSHDQRE